MDDQVDEQAKADGEDTTMADGEEQAAVKTDDVKDEDRASDAGSEDLEAESSGSDEEAEEEDEEGEGEGEGEGDDEMDTAEDTEKPVNDSMQDGGLEHHQQQGHDVMVH